MTLCTNELSKTLPISGSTRSGSNVFLHPSHNLAVPAWHMVVVVKNLLLDHSKLGIESLEVEPVLAGTVKRYFEVSKPDVAEPFGYGRQEGRDRPFGVVDHLGARWLGAVAEGCQRRARLGAVAWILL